MTDLITPVILLIFGGIMLIVVLAFVMAMKEGRPKYEKQDYFNKPGGRRSPQERWQQPKDDTSGSYSSRWDRQNREQNQYAPERIQRNVAIVVISLAVVAIVISIYTQSLIGLFLIFALPVIVRFLRVRGEGDRRRTSTDKGDSSSSV